MAEILLTKSYWKIKSLTKRFRLVSGGQGASKSYSIITLLFEYCINTPNLRVTILTSTYPQLMTGVIRDMQSIFKTAELPWSQYFNKSSKILTFPNESFIEFKNLDALDVNAGRGGRRDILFLNEANRLTDSAIDPYIVRTEKIIFADWNPSEEFWIYDKYIYTKREDVDFITLTYKDNQLIPDGELQTILSRIEASKQPDAPESLKNWVRVFANGELGTYSDRMIYSYRITDTIPITARKISSGMDFGTAPDKTALIDLYIDGHKLYIDEIFCENNLRQEHIESDPRMSIVARLNGLQYNKGQLIIADSASATAIKDLRKHGYHVVAVAKNQGAQRDYINKIRGYEIYLTERSINVKKDMESFFWKEDSNGKIIPEPQGHEPDTLAAMRYGVMGSRI